MVKTQSKRGIVALCSIVYFISYFSRKDFAAVMAAMLEDNIIDKSSAGLIGMMLFIFYGIGQLVSGYLGDKIKPAYLILLGLVTTCACNLLMPLVHYDALMIIVWGVNGFAQAMLWPPIVRILSDNLDHERYVTASLIVTTAAHVSTVLLYLYVPLCLKLFNWKTVFLSASALSALSILIFALCIDRVISQSNTPRAKIKEKPQPVSEQVSIWTMIKSTGVVYILGCIVACGFLRDGIESWLPTLYSEAFSRAASESILVSVLLPIFAVVAITVTTAIHKKPLFNNEARGAAILFILSIVFSVPLAFTIAIDTPFARAISLILACLICGLMHGVNFLLISCVPGRFARFGRVATVGGICNACIYIGAATSMYGIALVSDYLGWSATVISWIAVAAIGVLLVIPAYFKYTSFIENK